MAREQPGRPKQSPLGPQFEALEPRDWALDKDVEALASARANKPTSAETRRLGSELFDEILFLALLASLGLAPLSFVSNASFNWREIAVFFAILATLYEFGLLISDRSRPVAARRLWFPALAFALVCVRLLAQLGPAAAAADPPSIWGIF